jgi:hypothetical protein
MNHLKVFDNFDNYVELIDDIFQEISDEYHMVTNVVPLRGSYAIGEYRVRIINSEEGITEIYGNEIEVIKLVFQLIDKCRSMLDLEITHDKIVLYNIQNHDQIIWSRKDGLENIINFLESKKYTIDYIILRLSHQ